VIYFELLEKGMFWIKL